MVAGTHCCSVSQSVCLPVRPTSAGKFPREHEFRAGVRGLKSVSTTTAAEAAGISENGGKCISTTDVKA